MLNANDLLGSLLQGGGPRGHAHGRLEHAIGDRGLGGAGGPLGQILGGLGGGVAPRGTSGHQGGGGFGGDILGSLASMLGASGLAERAGYGGGIGVPAASAGHPAPAGGGRSMGRDIMMGGLGALAASILAGRGRGGAMGGGSGGGIGGVTSGVLAGLPGGRMRGAIGAGGLALLGMLAMKALRGNQAAAQGPVSPPAAPSAATEPVEMPPEQALSEGTAMLVLRAMIEAAKADGRVDPTERQRIVAKAQEGGADPEAVAYLDQALEAPADTDGLTRDVRDPVVAAQVYAASLLAIQVDTPAEHQYLRGLADRLGLEPAVAAQLHAALGAPPPA